MSALWKSALACAAVASALPVRAEGTKLSHGTAPMGGPVAVLPVLVKGLPAADDVSAMLTQELSLRLAETPGLNVVGAEEVRALLAHEAERQGLGCADDGCLMEVVGALGARFVVTGSVSRVDARLVWAASMVDQKTAQVVTRAYVQAHSVESLLAQSQDMVQGLLGTRLLEQNPAKAMHTLGFRKQDDVARFQRYRQEHSQLPFSEALASFIRSSNAESPALATAEVATLWAAGAALAAGMMLPGLAFVLPTNLGVVALLSGCGLLGVGVAGVGVAVALLVVDAMDLGRVRVSERGCCRDDAQLIEDQQQTGLLRALAATMLLAGPSAAAVGGTLLIAVPVGLILALPQEALDQRATYTDALYPLYVLLEVGVVLLAFPALLLLVSVSGAAGLLQMVQPQGPWLESDPGPQSPEEQP